MTRTDVSEPASPLSLTCDGQCYVGRGQRSARDIASDIERAGSHAGCSSDAGRFAHCVVFEQRYAWGRAYRSGTLVCGRVNVIVDTTRA